MENDFNKYAGIVKKIESIFVENELSIFEVGLVLERIKYDLKESQGHIKVSSFLV